MKHTNLEYITLAKNLSCTIVDQFNPSFCSDLAEMSLVFSCRLEHYSCGIMMDTPIYPSPSVSYVSVADYACRCRLQA